MGYSLQDEDVVFERLPLVGRAAEPSARPTPRQSAGLRTIASVNALVLATEPEETPTERIVRSLGVRPWLVFVLLFVASIGLVYEGGFYMIDWSAGRRYQDLVSEAAMSSYLAARYEQSALGMPPGQARLMEAIRALNAAQQTTAAAEKARGIAGERRSRRGPGSWDERAAAMGGMVLMYRQSEAKLRGLVAKCEREIAKQAAEAEASSAR